MKKKKNSKTQLPVEQNSQIMLVKKQVKQLFSLQNFWRFWLPLLLFVVSMFIRTYKIDSFLFFGFEQGLDAERVRSIIRLEDFRLVGTKTDIDGIFQGGWWYYLMVIPYLFGNGDPIYAAVFVAFINSLAVLLLYGMAKDFFQSRKLALLVGLFAAVNFDFVTYSRWITINDPALPLVILSFWSLWRYIKQAKTSWFVLFAFAASFAAQFQIVLVFCYAFVLLVLLATRVLRFPKIKQWLLAALAAATLFVPYVLFNIRNQWITVTSTLEFLKGTNSEMVYKPSLLESLRGYSTMMLALLERTFLPGLPKLALVLGVIMFAAVAIFMFSKKTARKQLIFIVAWVFMTVPYLLFTQSLGLHQLYIGTSAAMIMLLIMLVQILGQEKLFWVRNLRLLSILLLVIGSLLTSKSILTNRGYYFFSGVDGMYLPDELRVVDAIHRYGQGEKYRVEAFTIPYLSPNAWTYLRTWRYPEENYKDGDIIYVIIQPGVSPVWQDKWIQALKATDLDFSVKFGEITLEKRRVVPDEARGGRI